jgi:hypothetical protein
MTTLKVGDIVGNTVHGFNFKVIDIAPIKHFSSCSIKVKNLKTGETFLTHKDNMYPVDLQSGMQFLIKTK